MKATMHFDTLTYANKLKAAGMEPKLAEVQALALVEALDDNVATKADIIDLKKDMGTLRAELKGDMAELRTELKGDMAELRTELKGDMAKLKTDISELKSELKSEIALIKADNAGVKADLIKWMVSLFMANTAIIGAFIALSQLINRH